MIKTISPRNIISAFQNCIEQTKVDKYTLEMKEKMLSHNFPPINGFESVIDEDDIEDGVEFLTGEVTTIDDLGKVVWKVTDGHHRSYAAINANLPYLKVEEDYSTRV